MLANKKYTFSEILEILKIDSGHLSYHLEGLEDLISKTKNGKYKLSYLGEAAVTTMTKVERGPFVEYWKKPNILKPLILIFILLIGIVYVQSQFNELNSEVGELEKINEILWNQYFSIIEPLKYSPPMSKNEAIQKAIHYGNWNSSSLEGLTVNATFLLFKFEEQIIENSNKSALFIVSSKGVEESVVDFSPKTEGNFIYGYTWVITINPIRQAELGYLSALTQTARGYYFFDAYTGEIYPHLSSPIIKNFDA
jgi:hypothetical protein